MNGTKLLRIATAATCIAALAAPGSALAKKHRAHKAKAPAVTVVVPHKYDAGGDGDVVAPIKDGVRLNLFDPVQFATALGDKLLGDLGLPPLPPLPPLPLA